MNPRILVVALGALSLLACGKHVNPVSVDMKAPADLADIVAGDLADQTRCTALADYAEVGKLTGSAVSSTDTSTGEVTLFWDGMLNSDSAPDGLSVQLYGGVGVFARDPQLKEGTFEIQGDELNYGTCSVCVLIYTDLQMVNGGTEYADVYMTTGGTVTLTSVNGRFAATVSNLTFEHVTLDDMTLASTPVGDGCNSAVTSVSFDDAISPM